MMWFRRQVTGFRCRYLSLYSICRAEDLKFEDLICWAEDVRSKGVGVFMLDTMDNLDLVNKFC